MVFFLVPGMMNLGGATITLSRLPKEVCSTEDGKWLFITEAKPRN
jgi:hypothetical protein